MPLSMLKHSVFETGSHRSLTRRERRLFAPVRKRLCSICRAHARLERLLAVAWDIDPNASTGNDTDEAQWEFSLGTLGEVAARARTCPLCRLIHSALVLDYAQYWPGVVGHVNLGSHDQVIVRGESDMFGPKLRIDALEELYMQEFFVRVMNPDNRLYSRTMFREHVRPYSRDVQQPEGCQVSVHLVRDWLDACTHEHGQRCKWTTRQKGGRPLLFIDVVGMRLIEGTFDDDYIALSYVWGKATMLQTTRANVSDFKQPGRLGQQMEEIPQTIRDAIAFTRGVGERYLWTDCLCIVQDDPATKHGQIAQMDLVYSCASLTLVALSGVDAESGLPGVSPNSRRPPLISGIGGTTLGLVSYRTLRHRVDDQRDMTYATRAWTYQENLLSRRCLYFNEQAAIFICRKTTGYDHIMPKRDRRWAISSDYSEFNPLYRILPNEQTAPPDTVAFEVYRILVRHYTARKMSFNSDIINAFTGIIDSLKAFHTDTYACGLPMSQLDEALCWFHRNPDDESTGRARISRRRTVVNQQTQKTDYVCPSWTWAGWDGHVLWFQGLRANKIGKVELGPLTFPHPLPKPILHYQPAHQTDGEDDIIRACEVVDRRTHTSDLLPEPNSLHFWALVAPASDFTLQIYNGPVFTDQEKVYIYDNISKCGILYTNYVPLDLANKDEEEGVYELAVLSEEIRYTDWNAGPWCLQDILDLDRSRNYKPPAGVLVMLLRRTGKVSQRVAIGLFNAPVLWSLEPQAKPVWLA